MMPVSSKGLGLSTFLVVEARIETRLSILDIRASFYTSFLLRNQRLHLQPFDDPLKRAS